MKVGWHNIEVENDYKIGRRPPFLLRHSLVFNNMLVALQVEQVSFAAILDVLIIIVMAAIWAFMPTDGIAIVTQWFYNKVIEVNLWMNLSQLLHDSNDVVNCCQYLATEHHGLFCFVCCLTLVHDWGVAKLWGKVVWNLFQGCVPEKRPTFPLAVSRCAAVPQVWPGLEKIMI